MRYYIKDHGETAGDTLELPGCYLAHDFISAMEAAEDFWHDHNGWDCQWPVTITLVDDDGVESDWDVEMEAVPSFSASRCKAEQARKEESTK